MDTKNISQKELRRRAYFYLLLYIPLMMAILFLPAGTFAYWQAWVYLAVIFIPSVLMTDYLIKNDPELLERRMRMREKETKQRLIAILLFLHFLVTFTLPGFDKRFNWSHVPVAAVFAADILVLIGYAIVAIALKENRYASRIIEVEPGQKVIGTGPYAIVRHPMYAGALFIYLFSPLALGSFWALIPALLIIPILAARMLNEESVLIKELPGYVEYMNKTQYRLIPGVW